MKKKVISYDDALLRLLDQRFLPGREEYRQVRGSREAAEAIEDMTVRGAPAIGIAAAYGYLLGFLETRGMELSGVKRHMRSVREKLQGARPTAVNLKWALDRMHGLFETLPETSDTAGALLREAESIHTRQIESDIKMGEEGARLLENISGEKNRKLKVLTHCNAGGLATGGIGTALGVIKTAFGKGLIESVYVSETRPRLQGARLTCYELSGDNIPFRLICDTMPGYFMSAGEIDAVITGADRIAANGDTANKIGTYQLAVLSGRHGVPFYVAAPLSTFDPGTPRGDGISIEERDPSEVLEIGSARIAPRSASARNPAFDVTPAGLISAFITEKGAVRDINELQ